MDSKLINKYNKAVPRYTSYPTVPHWQSDIPTQDQWLASIINAYNEAPEISLYIHLPFCEALCTYCGCNKRITKNHDVEMPYIDALLAEWAIYRSQFDEPPTIKEIHLGGGTPTFVQPQELKRLLIHIINDSIIAQDHEFSFEAHPDSTSYDHLVTLYDLGFDRISIGVQDISPEIMKAINRYQTANQVKSLTQWARSVGYKSINYDIIYGLPFQNNNHISNTMQFVIDQKPDRIAFYSYAHVPWKSKGQRAFTIKNVPTGKTKNDLYQLGKKILESNDYLAIGMDHFCLPNESLSIAAKNGTMHRNFMGYTANYTKCSIALGASSIGDSWDMYVQNEKHVETYQKIVHQGKLPLIKGHKLSVSQMNMRQHILNLMCHDHTSWDEHSIDNIAITPFLKNLDPMVQDQLVEYNTQSIRVKGDGKYLIRNICAAIDPIYQMTLSDKPLFSKAI